MIKYRVRIRVSYNEAWFTFDNGEDACKFAATAVTHSVDSDDQNKVPYIAVEVYEEEPEEVPEVVEAKEEA